MAILSNIKNTLKKIGSAVKSAANSVKTSFTKDLKADVRSAVINKRAGGAGLISGRKAFKRPMEEGVKLLRAVQDVYLEEQITIA